MEGHQPNMGIAPARPSRPKLPADIGEARLPDVRCLDETSDNDGS
jgi:hypothetical protein